MVPWENGCQVYTVTSDFVGAHSLNVGPMSNLIEGRMSMIGLGRTHTCPLGYVIIWIQVDGVGSYDED